MMHDMMCHSHVRLMSNEHQGMLQTSIYPCNLVMTNVIASPDVASAIFFELLSLALQPNT